MPWDAPVISATRPDRVMIFSLSIGSEIIAVREPSRCVHRVLTSRRGTNIQGSELRVRSLRSSRLSSNVGVEARFHYPLWTLVSFVVRAFTLHQPQRTQRYTKEERNRLRLQRRDPLSRHGSIGLDSGDWLIITLVDVDDSATDDAGSGLGVDVNRKSEWTDIRVILHEVDLLDE